MKRNFTPGETNIICTDLERSLRFYRDVLGFDVDEREGPSAIHMHCADRAFLLLAVANTPKVNVAYCEAPAISFDLLVGDIEVAVNYLHDHGVQFETPWRKEDSHVFIKDPDGLVIEIIQEED
jgi:catechol 2,3-dioxygenase-like lactoylglutathione lyase family enzyme